jgi:hypothetical protein
MITLAFDGKDQHEVTIQINRYTTNNPTHRIVAIGYSVVPETENGHQWHYALVTFQYDGGA